MNSPDNYLLFREIDTFPKCVKFKVISWNHDCSQTDKNPVLQLHSENYCFDDEFGDEAFNVKLSYPFDDYGYAIDYSKIVNEGGQLYLEYLYTKKVEYEQTSVLKFSFEIENSEKS